MAEIVASGTTQAASADFTLGAAQSTTLYLSAVSDDGTIPQDCSAALQIKSGTQYITMGDLTRGSPAQVLAAVGTFRVLKRASTSPFSVGRD